MKFKRGDLVMVNREKDATSRADQRVATGRGYLPGRGHNHVSPIDFLAVGVVTSVSQENVCVRWNNIEYGHWWYAPEYLMPRRLGGF